MSLYLSIKHIINARWRPRTCLRTLLNIGSIVATYVVHEWRVLICALYIPLQNQARSPIWLNEILPDVLAAMPKEIPLKPNHVI